MAELHTVHCTTCGRDEGVPSLDGTTAACRACGNVTSLSPPSPKEPAAEPKVRPMLQLVLAVTIIGGVFAAGLVWIDSRHHQGEG